MLVIKVREPESTNLSNVIRGTKKLSVFKGEIKVASIIRDLSSSCTNLTVIHLTLDWGADIENVDSLFSQVFINNDNIRSLKLFGFESLTGECLLSLNKNNIEEICLNRSYYIEGNGFINSLPYFVNLNTIYFEDLLGEDFDEVFESIRLCSKLKSLTMDNVMNCSFDNLIKSLSSLKNIVSLTLNYIAIGSLMKSLFTFVSSNLLNLKYLNVSNNRGITDNDLESLSNLENLEELDISDINSVNGSVLVKFPNLKKLYCKDCNNLRDDNLIEFLKCASNLELLDIINSYEKIMRTFVINAAIKITKVRRNNVKLEVRINENQLNFKNIKEKSPLLHLKLK